MNRYIIVSVHSNGFPEWTADMGPHDLPYDRIMVGLLRVLTEQVNARLLDGFVPIGGVTVHDSEWAIQAMYRGGN